MIEAVVLYTSNDFRFFNTCIKNLLKCNIKTHVITYSHMWKGTPENLDLLNKSFNEFKNNSLVNRYHIEWDSSKSPWYWEEHGRNLGTANVSDNSDYILYIDIDEILDVDKFKTWLDEGEYKKYDAIKIPCYWYWREPIYRSGPEYNVVMTKTTIAKRLTAGSDGRNKYFYLCSNNWHYDINNPLIDHYSWVRTKDEMIQKVSNWGHSNERSDWVSLVNEEFSRPFNGKCFINNYQFETVDNKYNL